MHTYLVESHFIIGKVMDTNQINNVFGQYLKSHKITQYSQQLRLLLFSRNDENSLFYKENFPLELLKIIYNEIKKDDKVIFECFVDKCCDSIKEVYGRFVFYLSFHTEGAPSRDKEEDIYSWRNNVDKCMIFRIRNHSSITPLIRALKYYLYIFIDHRYVLNAYYRCFSIKEIENVIFSIPHFDINGNKII